MKAKTLLPAAALLFTFFSLNAARADNKKDAQRGFYLPAKVEELEGTWVTRSQPGAKAEEKLVYHWWGYFETFRFADDKIPFARGTSTIVDKWVDDEGSIWYRELCRFDWVSRTVFFRLIKLGDDARMWESVQSTIDFPSPKDLAAADRLQKGYRTFHRLEMRACCQ
jgi:hypothetical protein